MDKIKKDYLVEKYKNALNREDLKKFEEGLDKSSEHALSNLLDLKPVNRIKLLLLSIFLGIFGADRFYLGDKKLGAAKAIIYFVGNLIGNTLLRIAIKNLNVRLLIAVVIFVALQEATLFIWWIVDIFVCYFRAKKMNRKMLLSAAYAQPGPDTEKTRTYHSDTLKTMSLYDKLKTKMHQKDNERLKTALYYATDEALEPLDNIKLKSSLIAVPLSIFFGLFCVGSFYLENNKRAVRWLIVNLVLIFCEILLIGLARFLFSDFLITHFELWSQDLGEIFAIDCALIAGIIHIVLIVRYFKEILDVYDQVKTSNGHKIIDALSSYSVNRTVH